MKFILKLLLFISKYIINFYIYNYNFKKKLLLKYNTFFIITIFNF